MRIGGVVCLLFILWSFEGTANITLEFCDETGQSYQFTEFGSNIYMTSPGYPSPYSISTDCNIPFNLKFNQPVGLHIEHTNEECFVPYRSLDTDGTKANYSYSNCRGTGSVIQITTDTPYSMLGPLAIGIQLGTGNGNGFNLTVAVYPLVSMGPTDSTLDLNTTPIVYITSHQMFPVSPYPNLISYGLTLQGNHLSSSILEFITVNLGTAGDCLPADAAGDVVRVLDEGGKVLYECGDTTYVFPSRKPPVIVVNSTKFLLFEFKTEETARFEGFFILVQTGRELPVNTKTPTTSSAVSISATLTPSTRSRSSAVSKSSTLTPSTRSRSSAVSKLSTLTPSNRSRSSAVSKLSTLTPSTRSTSSAVSITPTFTPSNRSTLSSSSATTKKTTKPLSDLVTAIGAGAGAGGLLLLIVVVVLLWLLFLKSRMRKAPEQNQNIAVNHLSQIERSTAEMEELSDCEENFYHTIEDSTESIGAQSVEPGGLAKRSDPDGIGNTEFYTPIDMEKKMMVTRNSLYDASAC